MRSLRRTSALALIVAITVVASCAAPPGGGSGSIGSARSCLSGGSWGSRGAESFPYQQVVYGITDVGGLCLTTQVTIRTYRERTSGDQLLGTRSFTVPLGTGVSNDLLSMVDVTPYVTAANTPSNPATFYATVTIRSERYDDYTTRWGTVRRNCTLMPAGC